MPYMNLETYDIYMGFDDINARGPMVEIDEMIAPAIQLFNRKGYETRACCSGHLKVRQIYLPGIMPIKTETTNETYVWFRFPFEDIETDTHSSFCNAVLEKGFILDEKIRKMGRKKIISCSIRKPIDEKNMLSALKSAYSNCMQLVLLAEELPDLSNKNIKEDK